MWLIVSREALSPRPLLASLVFSLPPDRPGRLKVRLCSFSLVPRPRLASLWVRLLVLLACKHHQLSHHEVSIQDILLPLPTLPVSVLPELEAPEL